MDQGLHVCMLVALWFLLFTTLSCYFNLGIIDSFPGEVTLQAVLERGYELKRGKVIYGQKPVPPEVIRHVLRTGRIDVNAHEYGHTALTHAILAKDFSAIKELVQQGAFIDDRMFTMAHISTGEIISFLLESFTPSKRSFLNSMEAIVGVGRANNLRAMLNSGHPALRSLPGLLQDKFDLFFVAVAGVSRYDMAEIFAMLLENGARHDRVDSSTGLNCLARCVAHYPFHRAVPASPVLDKNCLFLLEALGHEAHSYLLSRNREGYSALRMMERRIIPAEIRQTIDEILQKGSVIPKNKRL